MMTQDTVKKSTVVKKSRFQIEKLEDRIAPGFAVATTAGAAGLNYAQATSQSTAGFFSLTSISQAFAY